MLCVKDPQRPQPRVVEVDTTPVPPLTGVECLAAWPIRPQTHKGEAQTMADSREDNVCNDSLHAIGLYGLGVKGLSLLGGLGPCECGVKLSHCLGYAVPGNV